MKLLIFLLFFYFVYRFFKRIGKAFESITGPRDEGKTGNGDVIDLPKENYRVTSSKSDEG